MGPGEVRVPMLEIAEEAPRQVATAAAEDPPPQTPSGRDSSFQFRNFTGCLLLWDKILFKFSCLTYVLVSIFLFFGGRYIWFSTLMIILGFVSFIKGMEWCCKRTTELSISHSTVDRFMFWIPYSFFCLYTMSIIHNTKARAWYIQVDGEGGRQVARVGIYIASCTAVFSMALGALKLDSNANAGVSKRMSGARWYTTCHMAFRVMEISSRIGLGVFLCESIRMQPWASEVPTQLILCLPFVILVLLYSAIYQLANAAGGKPFDSALPCLAVGVVTLAMNPMHFFTWPGYVVAVRRANKCLFVIRIGEVIACSCFIYKTAFWDNGQWLLANLGLVVRYQTLIASTVHWLLMALHSDIKHSTCQPLIDGAGLLSGTGAQMTFPRPGPALFVASQQSVHGLCQAWVRIGGGLHLVRMEIERPVEQLDEYQVVKILGGGTFGVVVQVQKLSESGEAYAMKLLDTSRARQAVLARREADVYGTVWDREHRLADDLVRVGHPFIVRLHFWSLWDDGRQFRMNEGGMTKLVQHPTSKTAKFHMALMMEQCDGNLESYLKAHFRAGSCTWYTTEVHFLAEIMLALEFLHEQNVAYRDLKPENVLIVSRPDLHGPCQCHCKLGDFGYSRVVNPDEKHGVSVAGTPYFCAPEMELRVQGGSLEARQAQENALDTYSYGTLAYALAEGPGYMRESNISKMGNRKDHPRCQRKGHLPCKECTGCKLLTTLQHSLHAADPNGYLVDLISRCVARKPELRPAIQGLRNDPLFSGVNFEGLLHLRI